MFGGNFAPAGWSFCDGSLIAISDNDALFNLIGTTYGGDGQSTFALPDLRSRIPVHVAAGYSLAQTGGVEMVTLTASQIPAHTHMVNCDSAAGTSADPTGKVWAANSNTGLPQFTPPLTTGSMSASALANDGGSQPHDNMPPYLAVNFIISLFGIFPSQT